MNPIDHSLTYRKKIEKYSTPNSTKADNENCGYYQGKRAIPRCRLQ